MPHLNAQRFPNPTEPYTDSFSAPTPASASPRTSLVLGLFYKLPKGFPGWRRKRQLWELQGEGVQGA